jgi:hypothetical protein
MNAGLRIHFVFGTKAQRFTNKVGQAFSLSLEFLHLAAVSDTRIVSASAQAFSLSRLLPRAAKYPSDLSVKTLSTPNLREIPHSPRQLHQD